MASQLLHDLADDLENAWREVQGFRSSVDSKVGSVLGRLRSHAESDGSQLAADFQTAAGRIAHDIATDAAPVIADVESDVRDLAQTAEQSASAPAASESAAAPQSSDPQPAA